MGVMLTLIFDCAMPQEFPGFGVFEGKITSYDGEHYTVYYDKDGDEEELSEWEFEKLQLVDDEQAASTKAEDTKVEEAKVDETTTKVEDATTKVEETQADEDTKVEESTVVEATCVTAV